MLAPCTFCSAELPAAPPGAAVRCASCGNLTITASLPETRAIPASAAPAPSALPFSRVDGPRPGASPPPTVILPSRAGGIDELIGGGITILGIGIAKFVLISMLGLGGACLFTALGFALHC